MVSGTKGVNYPLLCTNGMNEGQLHTLPARRPGNEERELHPAWREFIRYCNALRHGEVEKLTIQDGVPVLAELTRKKVKFTRDR